MPPDLKPALARLARGESLAEAEAESAFGVIMEGAATPAQIAAMAMAMRVRGETVEELAGAARAVRARMRAVPAPPGAIDVCGTGGDGLGTLNVSTAVTFVVGGCGVPVAKHGNRGISSRSGGADVLTALGVETEPPFARLPAILDEAGAVFLLAPRHHAALRHAAGPRSELGVRTIFNLLGPLANPAGVTRQLLGVFDPAWTVPVAEALLSLGTVSAWVVHGGGTDELSLAGENRVAVLADGSIRAMTIRAADAGLPAAPAAAIAGGEAADNAAALLDLLNGARGAYRDTVLFNAAAALVIAGVAGDLREGVAMGARSLDEGRARACLERLRVASRAPV